MGDRATPQLGRRRKGLGMVLGASYSKGARVYGRRFCILRGEAADSTTSEMMQSRSMPDRICIDGIPIWVGVKEKSIF